MLTAMVWTRVGRIQRYQREAEIASTIDPVQGAKFSSTRLECLKPGFAVLAENFQPPRLSNHPLSDLQYHDLRYVKIPRAMHFSDRVSMMFCPEVRAPFLDYRIVKLGLSQPASRKLRQGQGE